jgi:hypothetical protein
MNAWIGFACAGLLIAGCSDFSGDPPDPGAAGPNDAGPRSHPYSQFGTGGSTFNGSGGSFNNGAGGSFNGGAGNNAPVSKATMLASGVNAQAIALDDSNVYVISNQGLLRIPKSGGNFTPIGILQQGGVGGLVVDADNVYYVDNSGAIQAVPKAGGPPKQIVPPGTGGGGGPLLLDGDTFYYTVGPEVRKAPYQGGTATTLVMSGVAQENNQQHRLAFDSTYVYYVGSPMMGGGGPGNNVMAVPKAGGDAKVVVAAKGSIGALVSSSLGVVYTDFYAFGSNMLDVTGASASNAVKVQLASITVQNGNQGGNQTVGVGVAYDPTANVIYLGANGMQAIIGPTEVKTIDETVVPVAIALDATDIYFADWGGGTGPNPNQPGVKKLPR